jgi:hypothetical protein
MATSTFDVMKTDTTLGRAEALRRAMLAYIDDASDPRNAIRHTRQGEPFMVVSEGGSDARR